MQHCQCAVPGAAAVWKKLQDATADKQQPPLRCVFLLTTVEGDAVSDELTVGRKNKNKKITKTPSVRLKQQLHFLHSHNDTLQKCSDETAELSTQHTPGQCVWKAAGWSTVGKQHGETVVPHSRVHELQGPNEGSSNDWCQEAAFRAGEVNADWMSWNSVTPSRLKSSHFSTCSDSQDEATSEKEKDEVQMRKRTDPETRDLSDLTPPCHKTNTFRPPASEPESGSV
ncbi:uncharacterized protein V6R79_011660 [Siganus canaliculatus]